MADVERSMDVIVRLRDQASRQLSGVLGKIQQAAAPLRQVGIGMAAAGGAITGAMALSAKSAMEFEDVMKDVEIQSGATAEEMRAIKDIALSPDFVRLGKSGTDVATMFRRLASEGYEVAQMRKNEIDVEPHAAI